MRNEEIEFKLVTMSRLAGGMFGFDGKTKQLSSSSSSLNSIVTRSLRRTIMSGDSLTRSDLVDV